MTTNHIKTLHAAKPFRPFRIHLADGTSVDVTHPELMLLSQGGRTVFVNTSGEDVSIIDQLLVTRLTYLNARNGRQRKRGG
jgi:hypothetical protein